MLLVITSAAIGNAQEVVTTTPSATATKVTAEIIASSSTKVVKGSPFSAEGISESNQVLSDGNKITRSATTKMYRDSEGRFRREGAGSTSNGNAVASSSTISTYDFQNTISIYDPVDAVRYILNPATKSARRFNNQNILTEGAVFVNGQSMSPAVRAQIETSAARKANIVVMPNVMTGKISGGKTEQLGTKTIEGVEAEGTRTVTTLAAGAIGNEKPIEIVYERWYSKDLDLIVYSCHYDPRIGEQTYRLINLNRNEPDRSLFTIPSDYKITAETPVKVYTTKQQ
jgi:hypothetical protein